MQGTLMSQWEMAFLSLRHHGSIGWGLLFLVAALDILSLPNLCSALCTAFDLLCVF